MRRQHARKRRLASAAAVFVVALAMVASAILAPVRTALADGRVTIRKSEWTSGGHVVDTDSYTKSVLVFKANPSDNANPAIINPAHVTDWGSANVKTAVMDFLNGQGPTDTKGASQTYAAWRTANSIADADKPENVAAYLGEEIANDNAMSPSYHTHTTSPNVPHVATGFAQKLAEALKGVTDTSVVTTFSNGVFSASESGYYLLTNGDNTVPPIWLPYNSTAPDGEVYAKTGVPTLNKLVQENNEGFVKITDAANKEAVDFQITATLVKGKKYDKVRFLDTLPAGLTLLPSTIKITQDGVDVTADFDIDTTPATDNESTEDSRSFSWDYTFKADNKAAKTFDLTTASADVQLVLTFNATMNDNAGMGGALINTNRSIFKYQVDGKWYTTTESDASVACYGIEIIKRGDAAAILEGARFTIQDVDPKSNTYQKYVQADGSMDTSAYVFTTNASGMLQAYKIDKGYFKISEVEAPAGYAKIEDFVLHVSPSYNQYTGTVSGLSASIVNWSSNSSAFEEDNSRTYVHLDWADAPTGIVRLSITDTKDEPRLPITGMTPSQLGTFAGLALVAAGAFVLLRRSRAQRS